MEIGCFPIRHLGDQDYPYQQFHLGKLLTLLAIPVHNSNNKIIDNNYLYIVTAFTCCEVLST